MYKRQAHDIGAVEHAGAAVDDDVEGREILGEVTARCHRHGDCIAEHLLEQARQLDAADILAQWLVGAGLGDQDLCIGGQCAQAAGRLRKERRCLLYTSRCV